MIQNPFFLERRSIYVTLPFSFHVSIVTRLCSEGLGGFSGFSGGVKASGGQSSEDPKEAAMEKTVDIVHSPYRTFTTSMHDLDVTVYYELTTSFNLSSRVWSLSRRRWPRQTFAKNSSALKTEELMVPRGFIVNLVSFQVVFLVGSLMFDVYLRKNNQCCVLHKVTVWKMSSMNRA